MVSRSPNSSSTVYLGADGDWHGRISVGTKDNGKPDRRHVSGKSNAVVVRKVRALEKLRDQARVPQAGSAWTVEGWLRYWLESIARPSIRDSSYQAYRTAVERHLIPAIGAHRLNKLTPEHLESVYRRMVQSGASPATAHQRTAQSGPHWVKPSAAATSRGTWLNSLGRHESRPNQSNR